jgi:hypothetical protein
VVGSPGWVVGKGLHLVAANMNDGHLVVRQVQVVMMC